MLHHITTLLYLLTTTLFITISFTKASATDTIDTFKMSSQTHATAKNVMSKPLVYFGGSPIKSGYFRDGFCRTSAQDHGSHSLAGIVSESFLDFTASRGNDLRGGLGLKEGCRWCLCVSRWREAFDAHKAGLIGRDAVPKVVLAATEETALRKVELKELQEFAVDGDAHNDNGGGGRQDL